MPALRIEQYSGLQQADILIIIYSGKRLETWTYQR